MYTPLPAIAITVVVEHQMPGSMELQIQLAGFQVAICTLITYQRLTKDYQFYLISQLI